MLQSQSMEERMGLFLENMEGAVAADAEAHTDAISDDEADAMIDAEERAERHRDLTRIAALKAELGPLMDGGEKTKQ